MSLTRRESYLLAHHLAYVKEWERMPDSPGAARADEPPAPPSRPLTFVQVANARKSFQETYGKPAAWILMDRASYDEFCRIAGKMELPTLYGLKIRVVDDQAAGYWALAADAVDAPKESTGDADSAH